MTYFAFRFLFFVTRRWHLMYKSLFPGIRHSEFWLYSNVATSIAVFLSLSNHVTHLPLPVLYKDPNPTTLSSWRWQLEYLPKRWLTNCRCWLSTKARVMLYSSCYLNVCMSNIYWNARNASVERGGLEVLAQLMHTNSSSPSRTLESRIDFVLHWLGSPFISALTILV